MNNYTTDQEYQTLVTTYEKAKGLLKIAKAETEALKKTFKTSEKEGENNPPTATISYFQFQKALLREKSKKMAAYMVKLQLKKRLSL